VSRPACHRECQCTLESCELFMKATALEIVCDHRAFMSAALDAFRMGS
jgi:hypothetical protein